jgi:hypothetical protein
VKELDRNLFLTVPSGCREDGSDHIAGVSIVDSSYLLKKKFVGLGPGGRSAYREKKFSKHDWGLDPSAAST